MDTTVMKRDIAGLSTFRNLQEATVSGGVFVNTPGPVHFFNVSPNDNEIEALQQRLAHAQRQLASLKGLLMREKQARMRAESMESNGADVDQEEGEEGEESKDAAGTENKKTKKPFKFGRGRGRGVALIPGLAAASRNDGEGARRSQYPEDDEVADTEQELEGMDPAFANVLRRGPLGGSSSPLHHSILGPTAGRGRKPNGVPFKYETRPGPIVDNVAGMDHELLGADVEGSEGEVSEGLKHVEGQTSLLVDGLSPTDTGRLPHTSANHRATISARSATFFSSTNMSIFGGSFHLNVINGPDPTNMAGNSTNTAEVGRNSRIQQSDLIVSDELLGIGSCGTVVHRGSFQGRPVAVKKLLRDFVTLAEREVSILLQSDNHPNVIQYYYQEARENFLFIAIELCSASLADIIEKPDRDKWRDIVIGFNGKKALEEITSGLDHLHDLNVVHRDIKPQNILISAPQRGRVRHRMLISDFGLCKKLDDDQGSFLPTTHGASAAGTRGWQAPEILRIKLEKFFIGEIWPAKDTVDNAMRSSSKNLTKSMDIFPLGCLFYYTLTRGRHPFGGAFEREVNILRDTKDISGVELLGEEGLRVKDLIMRMLNPEPNERPDTTICLEHPYFMQFPTASARNPLPDD